MGERKNPLMDLLDLYVWREDGNYHAPASYMKTDQRVVLLRIAHAIDEVFPIDEALSVAEKRPLKWQKGTVTQRNAARGEALQKMIHNLHDNLEDPKETLIDLLLELQTWTEEDWDRADAAKESQP